MFGALRRLERLAVLAAQPGRQASALYDEVERAAQAGDTAMLERAFGDMKDKFGRTTYAQQAGLLAAKVLDEKGNVDGAKAALAWVADKASDEGYQAIAKLRLAAVLMEAKAYDEALQAARRRVPERVRPLVADRRGDIYMLQGKKAEAEAEYSKAYKGFEAQRIPARWSKSSSTPLGVDPGGRIGAAAAAPQANASATGESK